MTTTCRYFKNFVVCNLYGLRALKPWSELNKRKWRQWYGLRETTITDRACYEKIPVSYMHDPFTRILPDYVLRSSRIVLYYESPV